MTGLEKMVERITGEARAAADKKVEDARSQAAVILEDTEKETVLRSGRNRKPNWQPARREISQLWI